jgi:hypothetical protein
MHNWSITDPMVFCSVAAIVVAYILYMIVRRRKGERAGQAHREAEL